MSYCHAFCGGSGASCGAQPIIETMWHRGSKGEADVIRGNRRNFQRRCRAAARIKNYSAIMPDILRTTGRWSYREYLQQATR